MAKKKTTTKKTASKTATAKTTSKETVKKSVINSTLLRNLNLVFGLLLLAEAVALVVLSNTYELPMVSQFVTTDSLATQATGQAVLAPAAHRLIDLNVAYVLGFVAIVAGLVSLVTATLWRKRYEADLKKGLNRMRWGTAIVTGGLAVLAVAWLSGVTDIALLLAIFALTEITALFSILVESQPEITKLHPKVSKKLAFVSGITPWLVVGLYLLGSGLFGNGALPGYIYWLTASLFVLNLLGAGVMYKHSNSKTGVWSNALYTERAYILLNFVTISALLGQVYFGVLR